MEVETSKCAAELDSLQDAHTWSLVILLPTVLFLFCAVVFQSMAQTVLRRRHERLLGRLDTSRSVSDLPPTYSESILQQQRQTTTNNRPGQLQINCAVLPVPETADQRRLQLQRLRSLQRMQFVVERPFPPAENPRGSVFCV
jgi:hypothetical protein